jgi:hypothetical protein
MINYQIRELKNPIPQLAGYVIFWESKPRDKYGGWTHNFLGIGRKHRNDPAVFPFKTREEAEQKIKELSNKIMN